MGAGPPPGSISPIIPCPTSHKEHGRPGLPVALPLPPLARSARLQAADPAAQQCPRPRLPTQRQSLTGRRESRYRLSAWCMPDPFGILGLWCHTSLGKVPSAPALTEEETGLQTAQCPPGPHCQKGAFQSKDSSPGPFPWATRCGEHISVVEEGLRLQRADSCLRSRSLRLRPQTCLSWHGVWGLSLGMH